MKGQFEKYVNLIRSVSWKISKKYNVDYDEIESQGFLIYCMALKTYNLSKSSFSTHLFIQLRGRLKDYAERLKNINEKENGNVYGFDEYEIDPFLFSCESRDYDLNNFDIIEKAKKDLDADSYNVFSYIISFEWLREKRRKPTVTDVMHKFKVNRDYANILWNNCRNFWLKIA